MAVNLQLRGLSPIATYFELVHAMFTQHRLWCRPRYDHTCTSVMQKIST